MNVIDRNEIICKGEKITWEIGKFLQGNDEKQEVEGRSQESEISSQLLGLFIFCVVDMLDLLPADLTHINIRI